MAEISPVDLEKALAGADYPADLGTLVNCARRNGAPAIIVRRLEAMERTHFESPDDLNRAVIGER
jgi:uncharacterized protein DUF2795